MWVQDRSSWHSLGSEHDGLNAKSISHLPTSKVVSKDGNLLAQHQGSGRLYPARAEATASWEGVPRTRPVALRLARCIVSSRGAIPSRGARLSSAPLQPAILKPLAFALRSRIRLERRPSNWLV